MARALRELSQLDEAEPLLEDFRKRFPLDIVAAIELAKIAEQRNDWPGAAKRWEIVKSRFPLVPTGYLGTRGR